MRRRKLEGQKKMEGILLEKFKPENLGLEKLGITSGRYDPPHPGHIANIGKIMGTGMIGYLKVFMLDSLERRFPTCYAKKVMEDMLAPYGYRVQVIVNKAHFGKITKEELDEIEFDIYFGGNLRVLRHLEKLGAKTEYIERSYHYAASKYDLSE